MLIGKKCPCGKNFSGGPRATYCPVCRKERQIEAQALYRTRKRQKQVRYLGSTDFCAVCGKPYTVTGANQRYCPDCAPVKVAEVDREQGRKWYKKNAKAVNRRKLRQRREKAGLPETASHPCANKGVPWDSVDFSRPTREIAEKYGVSLHSVRRARRQRQMPKS